MNKLTLRPGGRAARRRSYGGQRAEADGKAGGRRAAGGGQPGERDTSMACRHMIIKNIVKYSIPNTHWSICLQQLRGTAAPINGHESAINGH